MSDYDFVMNALVKWKEYCEKASECESCMFEAFCNVNLFNLTPPCNIEFEENYMMTKDD